MFWVPLSLKLHEEGGDWVVGTAFRSLERGKLGRPPTAFDKREVVHGL